MWRVLVVDDEPDNRELLEGILESRAVCHSVGSGSEAVNAFNFACRAKQAYDILLLDVAMPDMDGVAVLERIRAMEREQGIGLGKGTPVIMVTAHPTSFMKSFNSGCDDFVLKPVQAETLIAKMSAKLG